MPEINAARVVPPIRARRSMKKKTPEPAVAKSGKPKRLVAKIRDHDSLAGEDMRFLWLNHWDLSGRDLRHANLRGARLNGVNMAGSDLRGAVLEGAVLTGACLQGTQLGDADLRNTLVTGANFQGAKGLRQETRRILQDRGAMV